MGNALAVRPDYTAKDVRELARRAKHAGQARRLLAIASVLDGAARKDAAKVGGMDRQTLRDCVIRFTVISPRGLSRLGFSLRIKSLVPAVPCESLCPTHAPFTPVAARPVIRHLADLSQDDETIPV